MQNHGGGALTSDGQVNQGSQSASGIGSHDDGNSHAQEPERTSSVDGSAHAGNDQPMQQNSSTINEGGQNALRRNGAVFWFGIFCCQCF